MLQHQEPTPINQLNTLIVDASNPTPTLPQNNTAIPFVPKVYSNDKLPTDLPKKPEKPNGV